MIRDAASSKADSGASSEKVPAESPHPGWPGPLDGESCWGRTAPTSLTSPSLHRQLFNVKSFDLKILSRSVGRAPEAAVRPGVRCGPVVRFWPSQRERHPLGRPLRCCCGLTLCGVQTAGSRAADHLRQAAMVRAHSIDSACVVSTSRSYTTPW